MDSCLFFDAESDSTHPSLKFDTNPLAIKVITNRLSFSHLVISLFTILRISCPLLRICSWKERPLTVKFLFEVFVLFCDFPFPSLSGLSNIQGGNNW